MDDAISFRSPRARLSHIGETAVTDRECLELALARPTRNHKNASQVCRDLIASFGSFGAVLSATEAELRDKGFDPALATDLRIIRLVAVRYLRGRAARGPHLGTSHKAISYFRAAIGHAAEEHFRVFFLNRRGFLIADEELQVGTTVGVSIYPRQIMKRALELSAVSLILAHNHPAGDPTPSYRDIMMTNYIAETGRFLDIAVQDHIVVGKYGWVSFRKKGLLPEQ